jgi:hypothetical protein
VNLLHTTNAIGINLIAWYLQGLTNHRTPIKRFTSALYSTKIKSLQSYNQLTIAYLKNRADIQAKPNTVTYLGRARGVTRARQDGEFRAGPLIPLVDQAVTGFAKSTFDVELSDHMEEDLNAFRTIFPALSDADIQVALLPPFDRARAQAWWESDGKSDKVNKDTAK